MEKLIILRMFFCFPLFGLLLPDAGILISNSPGRIPPIHFIIETAAIFCILICTAIIFFNKRRDQNHTDKTNEALYS
jgi:1,4-dihydroxy-2-naphthoate octaprenyltransferase